MLTVTLQRTLLRWLLRELSTDHEDMIAFIRGLDADDDDAQALLEELAAPPAESATGPLRAEYQDGTQLLRPTEALRALNLSRASFYALVKRGTFPAPILCNDHWRGWPRNLLLEWADESVRPALSERACSGYAPFERYLMRKLK
jgi:predicted DNA-binding transcriptional regulator AlpA